jgi:hypothetical protein
MLDTTFTTILDGFLNSAAARTAGMPAAAVCPVLQMDSQDDRKDPCLLISVDEAGEGRSRQLTVTVTMKSQKARSITDPYLASALTRLRDQAAFYDHLATTAASLRTGYQLEAITYPAPQNVKREEDGTTESSISAVYHLTLPL